MKKWLLLHRKVLAPFSFLIFIWAVPVLFAQPAEEADTWKNLKYISKPLRDPFQSPFETMTVSHVAEKKKATSPSLKHLKVQGMIWGVDQPQVIINGKVLKAGEVIQGAKILAIRKEGIYVLYQGNQYILKPEDITENKK